jgi:hypothetical protein
MKRSIQFCLVIFVITAFLLASCNFPLGAKTATTTSMVANTSLPTTGLATATSEVIATAVKHTTIPGDPTYSADQIETDCNTGARLQAGGSTQINISGCDYWNREWLERPADSLMGTYVPALDILWAQAGKSDPWIFLKLRVFYLTDAPASEKVGFELDTNLDSRGNYLLLASLPTATTWTTDGVQVWQDKNGDVGGAKSFAYDQNTSDGYETKLFDSGVGTDPDLAWVRISPKDPSIIEFAFKASLLPNQNIFGWWGWTGLADLDPSKFELVDHDQDAQTWDVDNVCGWIFGEKPKSGQLANLCPIFQPTPTPVPTTVSGGCPVGPHYCALGLIWDPSSCSCKFHFIILPTATQEIIK